MRPRGSRYLLQIGGSFVVSPYGTGGTLISGRRRFSNHKQHACAGVSIVDRIDTSGSHDDFSEPTANHFCLSLTIEQRNIILLKAQSFILCNLFFRCLISTFRISQLMIFYCDRYVLIYWCCIIFCTFKNLKSEIKKKDIIERRCATAV